MLLLGQSIDLRLLVSRHKDIGRHGLTNEFLGVRYTKNVQHLLLIGLIQADVTVFQMVHI